MVCNRRKFRLSWCVETLVLIGILTGSLGAQQVELVSRVDPSQVSDTGAGVSFFAGPPDLSISGDGRYVVFNSEATNLVAGQLDFNSSWDVFLRDLSTGVTTLVSRAIGSTAQTGDGRSGQAVLSGDGRYVAFTSEASDLAPGQSPGFEDFLLYDRAAETISLIASGSGIEEFFFEPSINVDGRYIAFSSTAEHLVPGQQSGRGANIFLYDRKTRKVRLLSHTSASSLTPGAGTSRSPIISADGRYIVFVSDAPDLVPGVSATDNVFLYDRDSGALTLIGPANQAVMSADGRFVALAGPQSLDLYDRVTRQRTVMRRYSSPSGFGTDPKPAISADGRFVAFLSNDDDVVPGQQGDTLRGLFLYDRIAKTFTLVSRREGSATVSGTADDPAINRDGRFIAFISAGSNLVPGQADLNHSSDVFVFDRSSGKTALASHVSAAIATAGNAPSSSPVISANGSRLVFGSMASALVDGLTDSNQGQDVFAYETSSRRTFAVSERAPEMPSLSPAFPSSVQALSADGRWVAFESRSSQLVPPGNDLGAALLQPSESIDMQGFLLSILGDNPQQIAT